jgi:hypothetical protein
LGAQRYEPPFITLRGILIIGVLESTLWSRSPPRGLSIVQQALLIRLWS